MGSLEVICGPMFSGKTEELIRRLKRAVIAKRRVQFFGLAAVSVCETLANRGIRVVVAGLDQDYRGQPFDPIPQLLAIAEYITKELAISVVGGAGQYEPRCRSCFSPEPRPATTPPEQALFPFVK